MRGPIFPETFLGSYAVALDDVRRGFTHVDQRNHARFNGIFSPSQTAALNNGIRSYLNGATWNTADEIGAGLTALGVARLARQGYDVGYSPMEAYRAVLETHRERAAAYQAEHPYWAAGTGLFGEVSTPLNLIGRGRGGTELRRAGRRYAKPIFEGAIQGAFDAEPGQRLDGALSGAATSALASVSLAGADYGGTKGLETFDPGGHLAGVIARLRVQHPVLMEYADDAADFATQTSLEAIAEKVLEETGAADALRRMRIPRRVDESP